MTAHAAHSRRWFITAGAAAAPAGLVARLSDACLARTGIVCESCGDVCPEGAIRFRLRRGGPPLPAVDADRCTGCGACVAVCPAGAIDLPEGRA